ncbi:MAG: 4-(cytidine 5'-diphospho)-2-C-methyl-D-erythritol kinase [Pseudomonadota bacterium]
MTRVDETAFAKINLDLRVCGRRQDGYHDLDSLVVFADVGDRLSFEPADGLHLTIDGPFADGLSAGEDNLVVRAAKALAEMADCRAGAHIALEKRLPIAAGLGGGSADAAATLRGLVRLWGLPLSLADLAPLARRLGADVLVCLGSTASRMQGIGDRLTSLPGLPGLPLVLVNPGPAVATPDVFRALETCSGPSTSRSIDDEQDLLRHLASSVNDLEEPAIRIAPEIGTILDILRKQPGCKLARMSGSGATCFGLFSDIAMRDRATEALRADHAGWWVVSSVTR